MCSETELKVVVKIVKILFNIPPVPNDDVVHLVYDKSKTPAQQGRILNEQWQRRQACDGSKEVQKKLNHPQYKDLDAYKKYVLKKAKQKTNKKRRLMNYENTYSTRAKPSSSLSSVQSGCSLKRSRKGQIRRCIIRRLEQSWWNESKKLFPRALL